MPSYFIETYGCSLNFSDGEFMAGRLEEAGFFRIDSGENADVVIINSCTVKDRTWWEFQKRLDYYDDLRNASGENRPALVIAGCIPRANPDHKRLLGYALLGTDALADVADAALAAVRGEVTHIITARKRFNRLEGSHPRTHQVIEILPIAKGCLGACAYCQTRLARGDLLSYPLDAVTRRMEESLRNGIKEIWLTAQDTGAWGRDMNSRLPELLRRVLKVPGEYRIRLGMANPNHVRYFTDELLDCFEDERLYRFLHLPLQSGSDRVLASMNRNYSAEDFLCIVDSMKARFPDFSIATDVIAGLPGETDEDFQMSLDILKKVRPAVVNRSRYSPRPGTPASRMPQIHSRIISERSRRLSRLVEEISLENNHEWVGRECHCLIDMQKREGSVIARNASYKSIIISLEGKSEKEKQALCLGTFRRVFLEEATTYHLKGRPLK